MKFDLSTLLSYGSKTIFDNLSLLGPQINMEDLKKGLSTAVLLVTAFLFKPLRGMAGAAALPHQRKHDTISWYARRAGKMEIHSLFFSRNRKAKRGIFGRTVGEVAACKENKNWEIRKGRETTF